MTTTSHAARSFGLIVDPAAVPRSHLRSVEDLYGPAGRLEALLNTGAPEVALAALLCHPYPPAGGTMHNKVVYHAMKALSGMGVPVLRFNFRGVGLSDGSFDGGRGEQEDVRAAVDWIEQHLKVSVLFVGFSFGSYVGLRACCSDPRVVGRAGLGLPVRAAGRDYTYEFVADCLGPLLFMSGTEDEFCPAATLQSFASEVKARHEIVLIDGAEHFFQGTPRSPRSKLPQMQAELRAWTLREFGPKPLP